MRLLPLATGIAAAALALPAQGQGAAIATVQVPEPLRVTGWLAADLDGDGREDLVVACRDPGTGRRLLRLHHRRAEGPAFASEPSRPPIALERDVVAFGFADWDPSPGAELVLVAPERVVLVVPKPDGGADYRELSRREVLWPTADPALALPLPFLRCDFDGDGRDDLLLPEADGARVEIQRPGVPRGVDFDLTAYLLLPAWQSPVPSAGNGAATLRGDELGVRLRLGEDDGGRERGPLLRLAARTAPPRLLDVDGNGHLDLAAVRNGRLFVAHQDREGGRLVVDQRDVALPLPEDRLALVDPAFDTQFADLDGDRRLDLVLTTSARRGDEVEVRIDRFLQQADGSFAAKSQGRLRLQTLARTPQLLDVDGDGRLDLVAVTVRVDALRGLGGGAPTALEAQLNVFRGTAERFALPALLTQPLRLPARAGGGPPFVHAVAGRDGAPAALLLREDDRVVRRPLQRDGERWRLGPPDGAAECRGDAVPQLLAPGGDEVLVFDGQELRHVRWS